MNLIIDLLPAGGWPRFVADAAWESTLAGLVGIACIHLIARRPVTKACISLCAIAAAIALPIVSAVARQAGWGMLAAPAVAQQTVVQGKASILGASHQQLPIRQFAESPGNVASVSSDTIESARSLESQNDNQTQPSARAQSSPSAVALGAAIWLILSSALFLRLLLSVWQARRWVREAVPSKNETVTAAVQAAARRLQMAEPRVLLSDNVKLPTVFAFGSGVLLLPSECNATGAIGANGVSGGSNAYNRWFAVMCHELGHIRRHDGRNRLAVEIALALFPWQPLMWLLRREFLRQVEEACDDWVVAGGVNALDYAAVLASLIPSIPRLTLGATIMSTDAKSRIVRLLALRHAPRPRVTWMQLTGIAAAACAIVASIGLAQRPHVEEVEPIGKNPSSTATKTNDIKSRDASKWAATDPAVAESKPVYVLEPPDIVLVEPIRLLPKGPQRIERLDQLEIEVAGALEEAPIKAYYQVDADGEISLGPAYGRVYVAGLTVKESIEKLDEHLRKTLAQPQVALRIADTSKNRQVRGDHLIAPDGTVNLGAFGQVYISGMTLDEARNAIEKKLAEHFDKPSIGLEVVAYNSKVYYVIVEGQGQSDSIHRFPITGNETVLDALAQANATIKNDMRIWIGRPASDKAVKPIVVDWAKLKSGEHLAREYSLRPGDRIFLQDADRKPAASKKQRFPGGFAD